MNTVCIFFLFNLIKYVEKFFDISIDLLNKKPRVTSEGTINVRADCWLNVSFHVISTAPEKLYQSIAQIFHKNISLYKLNV